MTVRAVLFDAGNTLLFLDYERLAAGVSPVAGVELTAQALAAGADQAAREMERGAATDRERAARYLETLFRLAGVAEERLEDVRAALHRLRSAGFAPLASCWASCPTAMAAWSRPSPRRACANFSTW